MPERILRLARALNNAQEGSILMKRSWMVPLLRGLLAVLGSVLGVTAGHLRDPAPRSPVSPSGARGLRSALPGPLIGQQQPGPRARLRRELPARTNRTQGTHSAWGQSRITRNPAGMGCCRRALDPGPVTKTEIPG